MKIDGSPVYHVVAKVERADVVLSEFEVGSWVWQHLRVAFPLALAVCLMPDHLHLVSTLVDAVAARMRLNRLLGQLARTLGLRYIGAAAEPRRIVDREKLLRNLRYVELNAPREGLVSDPLEWLFSTHRDVVGATVEPWIDSRRLAKVLGRPAPGFVSWYHRYVSADPSVHVAGTPIPRPATPSAIPNTPLSLVARAVAASTRLRPDAIRRPGLARDLFVALAREQGWRSTSTLAAACACTPRSIQRGDARMVDLAPARLCLGDRRLLGNAAHWTSSKSSDAA